MRRMLPGFFAFALVLGPFTASGAAGSSGAPLTLTHRLDIETALHQRICEAESVQSFLRPVRLWEAGIFDGQMEASWIRADRSIDAEQLAAAAEAQAKELKHQGYAYGICGSQQAWIISTPAATPILISRSDGLITLNSSALAACAQFEVDAAAALEGTPRSLLSKRKPHRQALQINPALLEPGSLSVTCHPPDPARRGPELWALMPIGEWDRTQFPKAKVGSDDNFTFSELRAWLQAIRVEHALPQLKSDQPLLARFARELSTHTSIRHPRPLLRSQAQELKKQRGSWLGENRVKAFSPEDMAWLLWHSPQHRRLILNPKANAVGLEISQSRPEKLLVMVMARI